MQHYVAGFLFSEDLSRVAVVHKAKPAWQAGKINAIGGKIEEGETPITAMRREFIEETGVDLPETAWTERVQLTQEPNFHVHFFMAVSDRVHDVRQMEAEEILVLKVEDIMLGTYAMIPNLFWLIPFCLDQNVKDVIQVREKDAA